MTRKPLFAALLLIAQDAMATDPIDPFQAHETVPLIQNSGSDFGNLDALAHSNYAGDFTGLDQSCGNCMGGRENSRSFSSGLPKTQFENGNFSQGIFGWSFDYDSRPFGIVPGSLGWIFQNLGAPPPAGAPAQTARPGFCIGRGQMWQDLHILPDTQLVFDWLPSNMSDANFGSDTGTLGVSAFDAVSGKFLFRNNHPNRRVHSNRWETVLDLGRLSGLDVRLVFSSSSVPSEFNNNICRQFTWFDNVALRQIPPQFFFGSPKPGLWYNSYRSGYGLDLRRAPNNSYYGVWYTYQNGQPIWYYLDEAPVVNGVFATTIRKYTRNGSQSRNETVGRAQLRLVNDDRGYWSFDFYDVFTPPGQAWDKTEFLDLLKEAEREPKTGMWAAGDAQDPAWGFGTTLTGRPTDLFTTIYYYDGGGSPVWALAQGNAANGQAVSAFRYSGGLCPTCPGSQPQLITSDVGSIQITFNPSSPNSVSASVQLSGWVRQLRNYNRLSY